MVILFHAAPKMNKSLKQAKMCANLVEFILQEDNTDSSPSQEAVDSLP